MAGMKLLAATAVAALVLVGCGPSPDAGETAAGPVSTLPGTTLENVSATTTTATPPTTTPPTTTPAGALPAGWRLCTNAQRGYSIGHPAGWHTAYGCRYLDPEPLDIPPNTDGFFSAVAVVDGDTTFEQARQRADDRFVVITKRQETTIAGHRAVRYESEATGEGLWDKGSRLYSVIVDNDGRSFEVLTAWFPGTSTSEYQLRKAMVDEMVETVRFL